MFKFKQFNVEDQGCAMKIGTDGVLLGAWANVFGNCLDIGTGTGLVSLMLAQRFPSISIDAIEVVEQAVHQSVTNVSNSNWFNRIKIHHTSLQEFKPDHQFQSIVCNPPFFQENIHLENSDRKFARMNTRLTIKDLAQHTNRLLAQDGIASFIFPFDGFKCLKNAMLQEELFISKLLIVKGTPTKKPKRVLVEFKRTIDEVLESELIIELDRHIYTKDYINLTKEFYLNM